MLTYPGVETFGRCLPRKPGKVCTLFYNFEDYLVPHAKFASLKQASELPLAVTTDCDQYLHDRLTRLETQLATVNRMALTNELPDAIITESGLKITPLPGLTLQVQLSGSGSGV